MTTKLSLLVVLVLAFAIHAYAQPDVDQQKSNLTGAAGRTWVFKVIEDKIDGPAQCIEGGETWTFVKNGRVNIKRCISGRIQRSEMNWSMSKEGIDYIVTVGDSKYRFIYTKLQYGKSRMRLRFVSGAKADISTDRVFTFRGN